jgi:hypothetical protein
LADEAYPHGLLNRPRFGFEWRDGPPEGHSGDGPWLVAKGGEVASVAFPGTERKLWELLTDAGMVSGATRAPRGKAFLRRFTRPGSDSADQIRELADCYGSLSNPSGDNLSLWQQEIGAVRDLASTLDEAAALKPEGRDRPVMEVLAALSSRFTVRTHEQAALSRRVLGYRPARREVVYTYGPQMLPFAQESATKLGYRELGQITASQDNKATEALVRFARMCVQAAIERRLWGAHVGIVYDYGKGAPQPPIIVPATVLGALYLELDRKLRSPSLPPGQCAQCGRLVDRFRRTRKFCGPACRQAAWRRDHAEGSQEASRGF